MKVLIHRNVDVDAIVSAYLIQHFYEVESIVTDPAELYDCEVVILDIPLDQKLRSTLESQNVTIVEHIDHHHDSSIPSTAELIRQKFKDDPRWEEWFDFLVELANYCDQGLILKLPKPIKFFHIAGYISALKSMGTSDHNIIGEIFYMLDNYKEFLRQVCEAKKRAKDVAEIKQVGKFKVAIVQSPTTQVNAYLFENGVHLIIYKDGNNLGILRNVHVAEPDLRKLKPTIEQMLIEKGKREEIEEWFFHPNGFIACRGSRKHPATSPSVLTPEDLLKALESF